MIGAQIGRSRAGLRRTNRSKNALSAGQGATCADRGAVPGFGVEAGGRAQGLVRLFTSLQQCRDANPDRGSGSAGRHVRPVKAWEGKLHDGH